MASIGTMQTNHKLCANLLVDESCNVIKLNDTISKMQTEIDRLNKILDNIKGLTGITPTH